MHQNRYNIAFQKTVKAQIAKLHGRMESIETDITDLKDRVNANEGNIIDNEDDISALDT